MAPSPKPKSSPSPSSPSPDRRVRRTQQTLREALISLLLERGWEGVSVQDICDRANVGRSTFYSHFADKEELLVHGFSNLRESLHDAVLGERAKSAGRGEPLPPLHFVRGLVAHLDENHRLARATLARPSGAFLQSKFREMVVELFHRDLARFVASGAREDAARFLAGAFFEMAVAWLGNARTAADPASLERAYLALAGPVVAALVKEGRSKAAPP